GVVDQCGAPVEFPGCVVVFTSRDGGRRFSVERDAEGAVSCQIPCRRCPCDSQVDQIDQQQYPRVEWYLDGGQAHWVMAYEYRANTFLRRSADGLAWSSPVEAPLTGIWRNWLMPCRPEETIGLHPHSPGEFDCLTGAPPGLYIDDGPAGPELYLFVALGQNPGAMGCYRGPLAAPAALLRKCSHTPLFTGSTSYGPEDPSSAAAQSHFDFRTIS